MTSSTFLIGPVYKDGLRKDVKPHAIPEDAWEDLQNIFQFRGRMIRRYGYTAVNANSETSRLSTDGGTTFLILPVMGLKTQDLFSIGSQNLIGFDTQQAYKYDPTSGTFSTLPSTMSVTWSGTDYQFFWTVNYAGAFWTTNSKAGLNGVAISAVVTGATTTITTSSSTKFASGQTVTFVNVGGTVELNGKTGIITVLNTTQFTVPIATTNAYTSGGIALNSQVAITGQDGIRYYAATSVGNTWVNYNPPIDPNNALAGALLIFPYRGYLVFLNTTEGNEGGTSNFPNRARYTQTGTPYYSQPVPIIPSVQTVDPLAARDDLFGRGGATDAPTDDVIVGAGFIRDILVVYMQRSTWRLRFVNNSQNPFVWERVNVELGSSSTFSTIPFDKGLMAIGTRGVVISDANDTIRFDEKIPDDIFNIRTTNNGLQRVYGIRTFRTKLCYWAIGNDNHPAGKYPDSVLVFNYDTKNWSYFDDSFTCFGYYNESTSGYTWNQLTENWSSYDFTWNSGITQASYETVIAGNQQGFVFALEQTDGQNSPSLVITGISGDTVTSANHNLPDQSWIMITGTSGITFSDGVSINNRNFKISVIDENTFMLMDFKPQMAGSVSGASVTYSSGYVPIAPGTVQINIGSIQFTDRNGDGILFSTGPGTNIGTIDYETGLINLLLSPSIASTAMFVRLSSFNAFQTINPIATTGTSSTGFITKISNFVLLSKIFNFFQNDKRSRLSKIDFYTTQTESGQFICNVYGDSTNIAINQPLSDNPESNVVLTYTYYDPVTQLTPNQLPDGSENIYRLYCDATAETVQLELTLSDQQLSSTLINSSNFELNSLMVTMKRGGRIV